MQKSDTLKNKDFKTTKEEKKILKKQQNSNKGICSNDKKSNKRLYDSARWAQKRQERRRQIEMEDARL